MHKRMNLAHRLAQGKIPAADALRWGLLLAESLRRAHEEGRVHGFLTPGRVRLNGAAVELANPPAGVRALTPYTAPELLLGLPADARSDIFSFGAIFHEMLTGRPAFGGDSPAELAQALRDGPLAPTGSATADRLLAGCLARDPAERWQQTHKVVLELKLLALIGRKAGGRTGAAPRRAAETRENRVSARLQLGQKTIAVLNRAVADALIALSAQISALTGQVAALAERPDVAVVSGEPAASPAALARIELALQAFGTRMETIEKGIGVLQQRVGLERRERAVDSASLVNRLAEALETLQTTAARRSGEWAAGAN